MIRFLVTGSRDYTLTAWLGSRRAVDLRAGVRPFHYEELERTFDPPPGAWVFTDLERLGPGQLGLARTLWDSLAAAPDRHRLLNDPHRVLRRRELLERLYDLGRNRFRAVRASDVPDDLRYPVFVRQDRDHTGSLTGLLHGRNELEAELGRLRARLRTGLDPNDLLVVEYADASCGAGRHLKYSAVRIGDRILPRYRVVADRWVVKADHRVEDLDELRAEVEYLRAHPHADWVRETFEIAGIEYGRLDYGEVDGELQVWEINTNPTIGTRHRAGRAAYERRAEVLPELATARTIFHDAFREALEALDPELATRGGAGPEPRGRAVRHEPPARLARLARRERRSVAFWRRYRGWLRKAAGHTLRVGMVALASWVLLRAFATIFGAPDGHGWLAELVLLPPAVAALAYCGLRSQLPAFGRAVAMAMAAAGIPLVDALGLWAVVALPAPPPAHLLRLLALATVCSGLLAALLRGRGAVGRREARPSPSRSAVAGFRHLVLSLLIGVPAVAALLVALGIPPSRDAGTWAWMLLRGPLQLTALAALLATNRPGRWSPGWAFGGVAATWVALAWAWIEAPWSIWVVAVLGAGALGGAVGLSADPLLRYRLTSLVSTGSRSRSASSRRSRGSAPGS